MEGIGKIWKMMAKYLQLIFLQILPLDGSLEVVPEADHVDKGLQFWTGQSTM